MRKGRCLIFCFDTVKTYFDADEKSGCSRQNFFSAGNVFQEAKTFPQPQGMQGNECPDQKAEIKEKQI